MFYVTFNDGRLEDYDLVIGADGLHSATRTKVFTKEEYDLLNRGAYICVFTIPNYLNLQKSALLFEANQKTVQVTNDHDPNTA